MSQKRGPVAVQDAKGNPRKQRVVDAAPSAANAATPPRKVQPPRGDKLAPELLRLNLVRATDFEALTRYCYRPLVEVEPPDEAGREHL